jgi:hypothetical protein
MKYAISLVLMIITISSFAQKGRIEGKIYDASNNQPVPFANIIILGTSTGTVTDVDGKFEFTNLKPGYVNLQVTFIGYKPETSTDIFVSNSNPAYIEIPLSPSELQIQDVEIRANPFVKRDDALVSVQKIGIKEIETNPGSNRDISRVIQSFPGIGYTPNFRNDIIVRGGGPSESKFYLDDIEIPILNHFSTQGASGGPVGILNADFLSTVNYYSGSFPSNRGNALSGIFEFTQKDGNLEKLGFQAALGASEASITLDGPLGENSNFIFSARRSYLQFLFSAIGLPFLPTFNDYQLKVKIDLNKNNQLKIVSLGALDNLVLNTGIKNPDPSQEYILSQLPVNNQWSYVFGVVYKHFFDNGFHTLVYSRNILDNVFYKHPENDESQPRILDYESRESENKARYEFSYRMNNYSVRASLGTEHANYSNFTSQRIFINENPINVNYQSELAMFKYGGSLQLSGKYLDESLVLSLGARVDGNNFNETMQNPFNQFSPRFSASYNFYRNHKLNFGIGRYYQLPAYTTLGFRDETGLLLNESVKFIGADHINLGLEKAVSDKMLISFEVFYKDYFQYPINAYNGISLANSGADYSSVVGATLVNSTGRGRAVGFEALYRLRLDGFNMITSYTYVQSSFTDITDELIPSSWDSRHLLTITGTKEFSRNWSAGLKWRYSGGLPYTPYDLENSANVNVWDATGGPIFDFNQMNEARYQPFHQLDLRVDKKFFFDKYTLMLYFDIQNAYNFKNSSQDFVVRAKGEDGSFLYSDDGSRYILESLPSISGTVLPTLGIMFKL